MRRLKRFGAALLAALAIAAVLGAMLLWLNLRGEQGLDLQAAGPAATPEGIERGRYLLRAGNCMGCHTARGGQPWAGGRGIVTPFGTVYSSNLSPHATGMGGWTAGEFWRALHHGRSRDGRLLVPAFPYPNYTQVTREDADAMFTALQALAPVAQPATPHALRFPYDSQLALAVWRAAFFRHGASQAEPARGAEWNRGAYLVQGLGHCNACHATRNVWGATPGPLDLGGGLMPVQNWYAPALDAAHEAGVAGWPLDDVVTLLKTGLSARATVAGPMAEVVTGSTQHLTEPDLRAMAVYLQALPPRPASPPPTAAVPAEPFALGARLYERHCAACHGGAGEGVAGFYPALAGNRAVVLATPVNVVRVVLGGGFAPATKANPRPFGMPPFATLLSDDEVAAVVTYVRNAWGNGATAVSGLQVNRQRGNVIE